jgi:hypothetical protein
VRGANLKYFVAGKAPKGTPVVMKCSVGLLNNPSLRTFKLPVWSM